MTENNSAPKTNADEDRRKFLAACGKFAVVTPPAITVLLSTSLTSTAVAQSGGRSSDGGHGGNEWGGFKSSGHRRSSEWGGYESAGHRKD
jgi:hypothetical protein